MAYAAQSDWSSAIKELEYAKQIDVDEKLSEPTIYNTLGWSYLQAGAYDRALGEFTLAQQPETFKKLNPQAQRKVLINTGLTYAYLGQPEKAMDFYAKANATTPPQRNLQQPVGQPTGTAAQPGPSPKGVYELKATAQATGRKLPEGPEYRFAILLSAPQSTLAGIKSVRYKFDDPTFPQPLKVADNPATQFSVSYTGWGCLDDVGVELELLDGTQYSLVFDMCKSLGPEWSD